jgi:hypothetical protein
MITARLAQTNPPGPGQAGEVLVCRLRLTGLLFTLVSHVLISPFQFGRKLSIFQGAGLAYSKLISVCLLATLSGQSTVFYTTKQLLTAIAFNNFLCLSVIMVILIHLVCQ